MNADNPRNTANGCVHHRSRRAVSGKRRTIGKLNRPSYMPVLPPRNRFKNVPRTALEELPCGSTRPRPLRFPALQQRNLNELLRNGEHYDRFEESLGGRRASRFGLAGVSRFVAFLRRTVLRLHHTKICGRQATLLSG